jgi:hypothetical protein
MAETTGSQTQTPKATQRPGFTKEGKPYPGVDSDTGERKALTFDGAQKEFGPKRGPELYYAVAMAGGFGRVEGNPDLSLIGLDGEHKKKVDALLAEVEGAQATQPQGVSSAAGRTEGGNA